MPGLSTSAARGSTAAYPEPGVLRAGLPLLRDNALLRHLDIPLVVIAASVAILLGAPPFGCAAAAIAWLLQSVLAQTNRRWIRRAREPRTQLGLNVFEAFARIWLLAGAIVLAGVAGGRADGLAAGLTICGAYTVAFAIRVLSGRPTPPQRAAATREAAR